MPPAIEDMHVLRVVVRNGFGRDLAAHLIGDLQHVTAVLHDEGGDSRRRGHPAFHH
jgi:glutamate decarboxylase